MEQPPRLRQPKTLAKPKRITTPPKAPYGPAFLRSIQKETLLSGPGEAPPGFVKGQTSVTEWVCYWALFKIFGGPYDDPRKPPFFGLYPFFEYQSPELGGFVRSLGSAVVDFLIHYDAQHIAVRIQTEYFHLFTDSRKQASDVLQYAELGRRVDRVVDVFDQDVLPAGDGQKGIIAMKRAVGLIEPLNPILGGTAIRSSRLRVIR